MRPIIKTGTLKMEKYSEEEEKAILQAMEANRGKAGDSAFLVIPSPKPKENSGDTLIEVDLDSL